MRLIDADALMQYLQGKLAMFDSVEGKMGLVPTTIRNDLQGFVETILEQPTVPATPRWVRCEEEPPKPGCYLTASPVFHGDDYSWLYRLAWWTEYGLMDFVHDAEKESGWYIWNYSQDRYTEIEPMYWMPIEPPREDADGE